MATLQVNTVIRHLHRAVAHQDAATRSDGELLASFIDHNDASSFEALVRRHAPMVFRVCRRIVGNHHDAEDAFQATFLMCWVEGPDTRKTRIAARCADFYRAGLPPQRMVIEAHWHFGDDGKLRGISLDYFEAGLIGFSKENDTPLLLSKQKRP